ncbi:MAG TPA: hypothetical protein VLJ61_01940 [Pyrinomonadaceae bacterium]|nr:hypothetical protein [Pyrinomonadaceae bacterium]
MTHEREPFFGSDEEVLNVVGKFESCEFAPTQFKHREHLTVALCYLLRLSDEEALGRMRQSLFRFVEAHGINPGLYHETLTLFWLKRVRAFIESEGERRTLAELANALVEACGDSRLIYEYYSKALVDSDDAKKGWAGPDLRPLDF